MKKIILTFVVLLTAFYAQPVEAAHKRYIPKPYVGFDYIYTNIKYKGDYDKYFDDSEPTYGANIGIRMNEFFGMEFYYQHAQEVTRTTSDFESKGRFNSYSLDFIGYMPTSPSLKLNFLFLFGAGVYEYRGEIQTVDKKYKDSEGYLSYRAGLGMQYNFTRNLAVRAVGRYVLASSDYVRSHLEGSIGIQLGF